VLPEPCASCSVLGFIALSPVSVFEKTKYVCMLQIIKNCSIVGPLALAHKILSCTYCMTVMGN